ncbi:MAG TPA: hypothetical protein VFT65_03240, partial [Candidatus Angelobacter sp.]|nr:hypothetical protein [Candidatus Angelobacter sp.]
MDLLERYLQAVRFWLPKAQQADISAELRDDLQSRIEDKESSVGRPVTEAELIAILQQSGHPLWVAARYQPRQSLIGPALFPLYEFVLKIVALGYLVPWILVWIGMMFFMPSFRAEHAGLGLLGTWASFWSAALTLFGFVTLVFAVLERFQSSINRLQKWDPRKLPRVVQRKERVSRVESVFGLVFSVIFIVWWLGLPRYGHWIFGPLGAGLTLSPDLRAYFYWPLLPTSIVVAQLIVNLFRPQWTWLRAAGQLISDCISLWIMLAIARVFPYVLRSDGAKLTANDAQSL